MKETEKGDGIRVSDEITSKCISGDGHKEAGAQAMFIVCVLRVTKTRPSSYLHPSATHDSVVSIEMCNYFHPDIVAPNPKMPTKTFILFVVVVVEWI